MIPLATDDKEHVPEFLMRATLVFVHPVLDHEAGKFWPALSLQQVVGVQPSQQRGRDVCPRLELVDRAVGIRKPGLFRGLSILQKGEGADAKV